MLILRIQFLCYFVILTQLTQAQCDYKTSRYHVSIEKNVIYGVQPSWDGRQDTLKYDIYKPLNDGNTARPVLMIIHGGGFAKGNKSEMAALCEKMASQGLVCVSLGYRLGFVRPLQFDYPYTLDKAEVIRAVFRGQQDAKSAIRFLKGKHLDDSTDINQFYTAGFSAGAFIALCAGYYNDSNSKQTACYKTTDAVNLNGTFPRPDLGALNGNINLNGYDAKIKGVFNFFGAVIDTSYITSDGPKLFSYHQIGDPVVPCGTNRPYHGIGLGIPDNYPYVYGSCIIEQRMKSLGNYAPENVFYYYNGNAHEVDDVVGYEKKMSEQISEWICSTNMGLAPFKNISNNPIYPNPTESIINLPDWKGEYPISIVLKSTLGTEILTIDPQVKQIDLNELSAGTYILNVTWNGFLKNYFIQKQ